MHNIFHLMWIHKSINCSFERLKLSPLKRVRTHRDVRRSPNQHFFPHLCSVKLDRRKVWKSKRTISDPRPIEDEDCASIFAKIRGKTLIRMINQIDFLKVWYIQVVHSSKHAVFTVLTKRSRHEALRRAYGKPGHSLTKWRSAGTYFEEILNIN